MGNPIQYTSRTFNTVLADINADLKLVDKPDWWKRAIAGIMDVLSVIENATANQSFLRTAFTRRAVNDLCELIDYHPAERSTSSGTVMFELSADAAPPFTVAKADLVAFTPGSLAVPSKRFEARADLSVASSTEVTAAAAWNPADSKVTVVNVYLNAEKVRISTSGTMPTPFQVNTDYYAIYVDGTHIRLASSRANALAGTYITITGSGTGNHTITRLSRAVTCYQQTSVPSTSLGQSDGVSEFQEFPIAQAGVIKSTLAVVVNGVTWARVDSLVNSGATDHHYELIFLTDDTCLVRFGDGTYGEIPGAFDVYASYAWGGGADSNVSAVAGASVYGGGDSRVTGAWNRTACTGGADAEEIARSKRLGPLLLKARDRFVTVEDGEALTEGYGGVAMAKVNKNTYGVLSAQVIGVASGGGNPSSGLRSVIQQYLIDRSILESIDVRFDAATITSVNVTSAAKMASGYSWAVVEPYFRLAWRLFLTETGKEIADAYESGGVAEAVALINTIFSTTFSSADYAAVTRMLDRFEYRQFGADIQESDAFAFVQGSVLGIDYMTIASPSFPISLADGEITTPGTLTLTEIP